ncbi:hypothetical protein ACIOC1_23190 [Streptomyces sp. NPDC088197]|uniref:hypothetical protein n=1 Tax=unclassified Streptomyces TaxID=2593676 RepID=UPI0033B33B90
MTSSSQPPGAPRRSALRRFLSPGPDSSTTQLRAYAWTWAILLVVWISAQFWAHPDGLRRALYILLSLVSITQALSALALLSKRSDRRR